LEAILLAGIAVLLQLAATFFAFRWIRVIGKHPIWLLLTAALALMALRRAVSFHRLAFGDTSYVADLSEVSGALAISACMLAGVLWLSVFLTRKDSAVLKRSKDELELQVAARTEKLAHANKALRHELSERRRAEKALARERQKLFSLLDGLPAFVTLKAPDYSIRFANRFFRELFGEGQGNYCYEFTGRPEPCPGCPQPQVLRTKEPQNSEWTHPGLGRTFRTIHYPFPDIDGSPLVLTLGMDISERKRAEEALRQSEEHYRLLVNQIPAVVFKVYPDWSIDFFDDKIEALTGYSQEEFNSRRLKWSDLLTPEDLDNARKIFLEALKTDGSFVREYPVRIKSGEILWFQSRGQIFLDAHGNIDYISGVFFDITKQKQAQEKLRQNEARLAQAQRIARMGYWEWDLKTDAVSWSEEVYRIFNQDPRKIVPSPETFFNCLHPEDREYVKKELATFISGGSNPYSVENRIVLPDGQVRLIHSEAELSYDETGKAIRALGTVRDITEERRAQEALKES
jgi:PAS domain S-box-containing protein